MADGQKWYPLATKGSAKSYLERKREWLANPDRKKLLIVAAQMRKLDDIAAAFLNSGAEWKQMEAALQAEINKPKSKIKALAGKIALRPDKIRPPQSEAFALRLMHFEITGSLSSILGDQPGIQRGASFHALRPICAERLRKPVPGYWLLAVGCVVFARALALGPVTPSELMALAVIEGFDQPTNDQEHAQSKWEKRVKGEIAAAIATAEAIQKQHEDVFNALAQPEDPFTPAHDDEIHLTPILASKILSTGFRNSQPQRAKARAVPKVAKATGTKAKKRRT